MRLLVSTIRRHCTPEETSGYFCCVDLPARRIISKCAVIEPAYRAMDPNNRGGMRGAKGISFQDQEVAIANSNAVFRWCVSLEVPQVAVPSHSLRQLSDGTTIYLNTSEGAIVRFDSGCGQVRSVTKVTDGFLRGATELSNGVLVVGSMGELILFDWLAGRVLDRVRISDDPTESVFDVKEVPPHFAVLPKALPAPAVPVDGPPPREAAPRSR